MAQTLPETGKLADKASEACVLASMILDPRCIPAVLGLLDKPAFFFNEHQTIFDAIVAVWHRDGFALDGVLLRSELGATGALDSVGGVGYLQTMMDATPTSANVIYYAQCVVERRRYRDLVAAHAEIGKLVDEPLDIEDQVRRIQEIALGLKGSDSANSVYPVSGHATRVAVATQDHVSFVPTGLRNLDYYLGGLVPGRLTIIAGRPSMGKTSLAVAIMLHLARAGKRTLFFTLEMTADELMERMISVLSGVDLLTVKRPNPGQETLGKFYAGSLELEKLPIVIVENCDTPEKQMAAIRSYAQGDGVDLVVVDYLQLMTAGRRVDNRVQEVSMISRQLKLAAVREHIAVIALSQLNRECEARDNHRPRLSDLRDSGSIEQDADVVMLLHREDFYRKQAKPDTADLDGVTECIVAKQRGGPCGVAKLVFMEETTRFADLAREEIPI